MKSGTMVAMFQSLFSSPFAFLLTAISLIVAITIHECMHAFVADRLGDPTPRTQGRISLNPLRHLDPLGTLMLFIVGLGWGKPVMFDPYNLKNPRRDSALIALAGPASNIVLAVALSIFMRLLPLPLLFQALATSMITLNIVLAVFNAIPIHPLDGGKILIGFLPRDVAAEWDSLLQRYGFLILLLLILPWGGRSPIAFLIFPVINTLLSVLL